MGDSSSLATRHNPRLSLHLRLGAVAGFPITSRFEATRPGDENIVFWVLAFPEAILFRQCQKGVPRWVRYVLGFITYLDRSRVDKTTRFVLPSYPPFSSLSSKEHGISNNAPLVSPGIYSSPNKSDTCPCDCVHPLFRSVETSRCTISHPDQPYHQPRTPPRSA